MYSVRELIQLKCPSTSSAKWTETTPVMCSSCVSTGFTHQLGEQLFTENQPLALINEVSNFDACLATCDREVGCQEVRYEDGTCVLYDSLQPFEPGNVLLGQMCRNVEQCSKRTCESCAHSGFTENFGCDLDGEELSVTAAFNFDDCLQMCHHSTECNGVTYFTSRHIGLVPYGPFSCVLKRNITSLMCGFYHHNEVISGEPCSVRCTSQCASCNDDGYTREQCRFNTNLISKLETTNADFCAKLCDASIECTAFTFTADNRASGTGFTSGVCETFSNSKDCVETESAISGRLCHESSSCQLECVDVDECDVDTCDGFCTNKRNGFRCGDTNEIIIDSPGFDSWQLQNEAVSVRHSTFRDGLKVSLFNVTLDT